MIPRINVDTLEYFLSSKKRRLRLFLDDEELVNFLKMRSKEFIKYFHRSKFFLFVLLHENVGLKILINKGGYTEPDEVILKRIIKIQKIFYDEGLSFDCEEDVLKVLIGEQIFGQRKVFYGYLTDTDIDFSKFHPKEDSDYRREIFQRVNDVFKANNLVRNQLKEETKKVGNYITTTDGEIKFVDFDPKIHFKDGR